MVRKVRLQVLCGTAVIYLIPILISFRSDGLEGRDGVQVRVRVDVRVVVLLVVGGGHRDGRRLRPRPHRPSRLPPRHLQKAGMSIQ